MIPAELFIYLSLCLFSRSLVAYFSAIQSTS